MSPKPSSFSYRSIEEYASEISKKPMDLKLLKVIGGVEEMVKHIKSGRNTEEVEYKVNSRGRICLMEVTKSKEEMETFERMAADAKKFLSKGPSLSSKPNPSKSERLDVYRDRMKKVTHMATRLCFNTKAENPRELANWFKVNFHHLDKINSDYGESSFHTLKFWSYLISSDTIRKVEDKIRGRDNRKDEKKHKGNQRFYKEGKGMGSGSGSKGGKKGAKGNKGVSDSSVKSDETSDEDDLGAEEVFEGGDQAEGVGKDGEAEGVGKDGEAEGDGEKKKTDDDDEDEEKEESEKADKAAKVDLEEVTLGRLNMGQIYHRYSYMGFHTDFEDVLAIMRSLRAQVKKELNPNEED